MSLIKCPECGKQVSDKAEACPRCGLPSKYFVTESKQNKEEELRHANTTRRLWGSFQRKYVYEGDICPLCRVGTIVYDGNSWKCSNAECQWSQEYKNQKAHESRRLQDENKGRRLWGSFQGENLYEGNICPSCNAGTIIYNARLWRCSNPSCQWSQEQINKKVEESKAPSPGLCPVCRSGKLVILSMAPYMVRCSNPKCLNH